jgi:eukaryotic-like serine/threonine-protein kinase
LNDQSKRAESHASQIASALREYRAQVKRGEPVDREEFLARHAGIADQLRAMIAAEDEQRVLTAAETPPELPPDSTQTLAADGQETLVPRSPSQQAGAAETRTAGGPEIGAAGLAGEFGRYRIIRALGKGAMGTVYLAEDTHIDRHVALKTPHLSEDPTGTQRERFFREARSAGNLRHPHICPIYDFGQIDGKYFITMAYIEGRPLSALIQPDKPQSERTILLLIRKLALALQAAHDKGIVHRDLKPGNIMVDTSGEPIIMDFGLARQVSRDDDIRLTQTGNIVGTPAFMSPEQVEGNPDNIGPPTDQYSLGVILYELLTGRLPFQGSVMAVMGQTLTKEPPHPSQLRPEIDPRVEAVCLKMMAKTPTERFASSKAVADEITTILRRATSQSGVENKPAPPPAAREPTAPIGFSKQLRRPLNEGSWMPWTALALGLTIVGILTAFVATYPRRAAVVTDSNDAGAEVGAMRTPPNKTPDPPSTAVVPGMAGGEHVATAPPAGGKTPLVPLPPVEVPKTTTPLPPTFKNNLGMEFVLVPKGKSWLGGGGGKPGDKEVVIAQDFYLGKFEVTQEEWTRLMGLNPSWFSRTGGGKENVKELSDAELNRLPVENLTWDAVQAFLERLNGEERVAGWVYRLPTPTEWEYACRGGPLSDKSESAYDFYFDRPTNQLSAEQANVDKHLLRTCKVGSYPPNRLSLHDLCGNVWEWCAETTGMADKAPNREMRGGGWSTLPLACTAANRFGPAHWEGRVGIRLARVPAGH